MPKPSRRKPLPPSPEGTPLAALRRGKELKIALLVAIPFGIAAAVALSWQRLFPVPPEKLVEVVWTHQCSCAHGWMQSLRDAGFVVRDFEQDDLSSWRQQWGIPSTIRGCHPARFMGYFVEGHVSPAQLRQLAAEKPAARGIKMENPSEPSAGLPTPNTSHAAHTLLIDAQGREQPWETHSSEDHRYPWRADSECELGRSTDLSVRT